MSRAVKRRVVLIARVSATPRARGLRHIIAVVTPRPKRPVIKGK